MYDSRRPPVGFIKDSSAVPIYMPLYLIVYSKIALSDKAVISNTHSNQLDAVTTQIRHRLVYMVAMWIGASPHLQPSRFR